MMKSSKPEIPWRRVEPSFQGAVVSPQDLPSFLVAVSSQDTSMRAPARARRRLGIIVPIAIILAVASGGAYWVFDKMAAKPAAPVWVPEPAERPRLVGPAAPEPAPPARPSPNLVEGGAPLLALHISEFPAGDFGSIRQAVSVETGSLFRSKAAPFSEGFSVPASANRR